MEPGHAQGREQANPKAFGPPEHRWGAQPAGQATSSLPKLLEMQARSTGLLHAAVSWEKEAPQPGVAERGRCWQDKNGKSVGLYFSSWI